MSIRAADPESSKGSATHSSSGEYAENAAIGRAIPAEIMKELLASAIDCERTDGPSVDPWSLNDQSIFFAAVSACTRKMTKTADRGPRYTACAIHD
jgi:hypothetical protein